MAVVCTPSDVRGIIYLIFCYYSILINAASAGDNGKEITSNDENTDNFQNGTKTFSVRAISPSQVFTMMDTDVHVEINFTVPCENKGEYYSLRIKSTSDRVFSVTELREMDISCDDAVYDDDTPTPERVYNISSGKKVRVIPNEESGTKDPKHHVRRQLLIRDSLLATFRGNLLGVAEAEFNLYRIEPIDKNENQSPGITQMNSNTSNDDDARDTSDYDDYIEEIVGVDTILVTVVRPIRVIDFIFRVVVYVFMVCITISFGCGLNIPVVKEALKKPVAPGIGLGCQYIIMPALGFAIAKLAPVDDPVFALSIFVCGCCPGGGNSNIYTYLLGGDVSLSITMTLISSIVALGVFPLLIYTLGQQFVTEGASIVIPFSGIGSSLAVSVFPLLFGIFLKVKFLKVANLIIKIMRPIVIICIILLMTVGIYSNLYIFKMFDLELILLGAMLPYLGYIMGGLVALSFRQPWERVKTIALETGMQNVGLAFIMMTSSFPPPYGDIAAVVPAASGTMTPIPPFLVAFPYQIYKKYTQRYQQVAQLTDGEVKVVTEGNEQLQIEEKLTSV
ncbi:hypothetical protein ACJMK2_009606 [Sinanodonta woodiana]|uniref:Ileal sodium/bile acid cotransporter n=1 Tax=Sinanodonta woodiana TaxID=1069815 RepID=A0ABD3VEE3_SINWO